MAESKQDSKLINRRFSERIAKENSLSVDRVARVVELIEEGCTIAFIARYRKEASGAMDEVQVAKVAKSLEALKDLEARRQSIVEAIEKQGKLSVELHKAIVLANSLTELEDLYLPYKQKRATRAEAARAKGLQPLADLISKEAGVNLSVEAKKYVNPSKKVANTEEALQGARDIVAAEINENALLRRQMREYFSKYAVLSASKAKGYKEESKYKQWVDWSENALKAPSHRVLAMFRAEREGELSLSISPQDKDRAMERMLRICIRKPQGETTKHKIEAAGDCFKRLLSPSLENELHTQLKEKADKTAIEIFAQNLRQLLLSAPLGEKSVLAIDPGFRTGCKCVCLNPQGKLLYHSLIYLHQAQQAEEILKHLVRNYGSEAIAIGSGTASKETLRLVQGIDFGKELIISIVNEDGASVYSASEVAREEFGDYDITVRGAVSIGRRLQDPLAELVKIEPKSLGVGQYQHDVDQALLKSSLDEQVESCVNSVGVELNTASRQLLSRVSGIGESLANNIVEYRNENGAFSSRKELLKVKRFGAKAYQQAAGFLRVRASKNPLDNTAVHPERYALVERMAKEAGGKISDLISTSSFSDKIKLSQYVSEDCGMPTLNDIMSELSRNSRDIRTSFEQSELNQGLNDIADLRIGMWLEGMVSNITAFGAFINLGLHEDGLLHISQISERYIESVAQVLRLGQRVRVRVCDIDYSAKRISLSMLP